MYFLPPPAKEDAVGSTLQPLLLITESISGKTERLSHYGWRPLNLHFLTPPVCPIAGHSTADGASDWHGKVIAARQSEPWTQKVLLLQVTLQLFKTFLVNIHPHLWFYRPYRFSILCQLTLFKFCYLFRISPRGQAWVVSVESPTFI